MMPIFNVMYAGSRVSCVWVSRRVVDDFGNEITIRLVADQKPTQQCQSIWAFLR